MAKTLNIGLDVGSTTVKVVVMNNKNEILYDDYQRHFSDTKKTIDSMLDSILNKFTKEDFTITLTGSGALALSKYLETGFVQEVI